MNEGIKQPQPEINPMEVLQQLPLFIERLTKSEERSKRIERVVMRIALTLDMSLTDMYTPEQIGWAINSPPEKKK